MTVLLSDLSPHQSASNRLLLRIKISHESVQSAIWWLVSLHNCLISNRGRSLNTRPNEEEVLLCLLPLTSEALCSAIITYRLHIHHPAGNWTNALLGSEALLWATWAANGTTYEFMSSQRFTNNLIRPSHTPTNLLREERRLSGTIRVSQRRTSDLQEPRKLQQVKKTDFLMDSFQKYNLHTCAESTYLPNTSPYKTYRRVIKSKMSQDVGFYLR